MSEKKSENFSSGAADGEFLCFVSLFGQRNEKPLRLEQKLFERSEFFLFSGEKCRSRQKSADGEFFSDKSSTTRLCFVSFVRAKEMKSLRGLSESEAL